MRTQGLRHIYFGDGKGKTTAACGLALRAAGWGKRVYLVFFFKSLSGKGEIKLFARMKNLKVFCFAKPHPFFVKKDKISYKKELRPQLHEFLKKVKSVLEEKKEKLVILDEILTAVSANLISEEELIDLMEEKYKATEVVLTGKHRPSKRMLMLTDYVSEVRKLKHPYQKGICARKGIDF